MIASKMGTGAALLSLTVLAACSGGNTYGTGVTQESQLLSDIGSLVAIGGPSRPKETIDYNARPNLVRNPQTGALPVPVDNASLAEDPNFPTDPEAARAARLSRKADASLREGGSPRDPELGDGTEVSVDAEGYYRSRSGTVRSVSEGRDLTPGQERRLAQANREALLAERKKTGGGLGQGPRRFLTQPPVEYRTPAETAAVGSTGEREKQERKGVARLLDQIKE